MTSATQKKRRKKPANGVVMKIPAEETMKCRECIYMGDFSETLYQCTNPHSDHFLEFTGICCEDECNDGEYLAAPEQNDNERWAKEQK